MRLNPSSLQPDFTPESTQPARLMSESPDLSLGKTQGIPDPTDSGMDEDKDIDTQGFKIDES